ncbi:MAG: hypothetical protein M3P26_05715 [Gemmatimonadota bacterium]|nr:hypothetical protein [Gemmatimonadota bacterium]
MPDIVVFETTVAAAGPAAADAPPAELAAEPGAGVSVVEAGPATAAPVSDVGAAVTGVSETVLLLFAADAFAPALQAEAKTMIETRTKRYIFPNCC